MKNISQKKWFSLSMKLTEKRDINFSYTNFYHYMIGSNESEKELVFYFDAKNKKLIQNIISNNKNQLKSDFLINDIEYDNWHSSYEDYFKPIKIDKKLMIVPDWYDTTNERMDCIKIIPGMAFGTGNHETTQLIISNIIKYIKDNSRVLDLGSGSGILSIAALKYGASHVTAIEYDRDCEENFFSNMKLNHIADKYSLSFTDVLSIKDYNYDFILANINKNVILELLPRIKKYRKNKSIIILSGLLTTDRDDVIDLITAFKFSILEENQLGEWICITIS